METVYQLLAILGMGLVVWFLYYQIKHRPELFSRDNLMKSFTTMGVLGLILIVFVAVLVMLVRST